MDSVKFFCPACRQKLEVEAEMFGTKLQCPVCNAWMQVPNGPAAPAVTNAGVAAVSGKPTGPRYMLALVVGAGSGVALLAVGVAVAWWFDMLPGQKVTIDPNLPQWSPQVASSALQNVAVPNVIGEETPDKTEKHSVPATTPAVVERTSPPQEDAKVPESASAKTVMAEGRDGAAREDPPPGPVRTLSEEERRKVFGELIAVDEKALQEAKRQVPDDPTQAMEVGASLKLSERTPMFRAPPAPDAPQTELDEAGKLQPGATIVVAEVRNGRPLPWYRVDVSDKSGEPAGKGWVSAVSLAGQSREDKDQRHVKQQRLQNDLLSQYQRAIEKEHGITTAQARKILSEGFENRWDGGKRGDITGE